MSDVLCGTTVLFLDVQRQRACDPPGDLPGERGKQHDLLEPVARQDPIGGLGPNRNTCGGQPRRQPSGKVRGRVGAPCRPRPGTRRRRRQTSTSDRGNEKGSDQVMSLGQVARAGQGDHARLDRHPQPGAGVHSGRGADQRIDADQVDESMTGTARFIFTSMWFLCSSDRIGARPRKGPSGGVCLRPLEITYATKIEFLVATSRPSACRSA